MAKELKLRELLNFYDHKVPESKNHASAVTAVLGEDLAITLLIHYLRSEKIEVIALDESCTQKTKSGHRLDKWLKVKSPTICVMYQVEIKNWSAHSIGGATVNIGSNEEEMRKFRIQRWRHQFNEVQQIPSKKETLKVLTKMCIPTGYSEYEHEALLCFWEPLHPTGELNALFEVAVQSESFKKLTVFSISNYISLLLDKNIETLEVEMPIADARIDWLQKLYS